MGRRTELVGALVLDLIGAVGALLIARRDWQTALTPRARPFADDVLALSGYTLDTAATAFGLVALAGVVAVLATRNVARRVVGGVLALAGGLLVWRSLTGLAAIGPVRARALVQAKHSGVSVDVTVVPRLTVHTQWAFLSAVCGLLVCGSGLVVAARGHRWAAMSARYEAPSAAHPSAEDIAATRARADASMWTALDHGTDPTKELGSGTEH